MRGGVDRGEFNGGKGGGKILRDWKVFKWSPTKGEGKRKNDSCPKDGPRLSERRKRVSPSVDHHLSIRQHAHREAREKQSS